MEHRKRLAALMATGALVIGIFGMSATIALASTPASDQGVTPTQVDGNITLAGGGGNDQADCDAADGIETGNTGGSDTTDNGVTVTWTYDGTTKEFGFTATGGVVTIAYVKGGDAYNVYDYTGLGGVAWDSGMFAPDTNGDGQPQGLSHAVFCTGPGEETTTTTTTEETTTTTTTTTTEVSETTTTTFTGGTGGETDVPTEPNTAAVGTGGPSTPADSAWLLVVALGFLLGSVVVLTPAKARSRR